MPMNERWKRRVKAAAGFLREPRQLLLIMTAGIVLGTAILGATTAFAADYKIQQWQAVEIALTSSVTYTDPFQDVDVTATFTRAGR